ncbi:protein RIC-3 isoform X2 [Narcine bancroftii]
MVSKSKHQWPAHRQIPKIHQSDSITTAKGGNSHKSVMAQIIPIYGFGLLMYILYILFKISTKGKTQSPKIRKRCAGSRFGNMKRKITDYELAQLQAKLKETEVAMKQIASKMGNRSDKFTSEEEEILLRQLKEITRVMKEQKIIEDIIPEKETEESPCMEHQEGYPEETNQSRCSCQHDINHSESRQLPAEEVKDKIEDKCSSNEIAEDNLRKNQNCQGVHTHGDGIEEEVLQYEDWKYLVRESDDFAVTPWKADTILKDLCNVGGQVRDESSLDSYISEQQHTFTCSNEGELRKRNKMAIV